MKLFLKKFLKIDKNNSIRNQLIRGGIGVGGLKILSIPISLAASILVARFLGPEGYGQYSFVMAVVTVLSLPIGGGIRQLVTREIASYKSDEKWSLFRGILKRSHQCVIIFSCICVLITSLISVNNITWEINDRWTLLFIGIFYLPFLGFKSIRTGTLRGLGSVVAAQIPELLVKPAFHLINISILLLFGLLNPATALFSQIISVLIAFMIGTYLLFKKTPKKVSNLEADFDNKSWFLAWIPFTLLMAASMFNNQLGILLLGWLGDDAEMGALRVADRGAQFVSFSLVIVNMVISPYITDYFKKNDRNKLQKLSKQSARYALLFAIPVALPMIFLGAPIINIIFGEEYVSLATIPLAILAISNLVSVAIGSVGMFLTMSGFERDTLLGQIVSLIVNAVLAVILIPKFGADGAALASASGMITWNIILAYKFKQRLKLKPSIF